MTAHRLSDLELLAAWQRGDSDAGDELVHRHFTSVYRFFAGKLDDGIDDLVQRTFLVCVERRRKLRKDSSIRAYLLGIARNILFEQYRVLRNNLKLTTIGELSAEALGSPSGLVAMQDEHRLLLLALRQLPLDLQIALELFFWEELSIAEIADVLEIPPGTVKSRLHRAKGLLRDRIQVMEVSADLLRSTLNDLDGWAQSMRGALGVPED